MPLSGAKAPDRISRFLLGRSPFRNFFSEGESVDGVAGLPDSELGKAIATQLPAQQRTECRRFACGGISGLACAAQRMDLHPDVHFLGEAKTLVRRDLRARSSFKLLASPVRGKTGFVSGPASPLQPRAPISTGSRDSLNL